MTLVQGRPILFDLTAESREIFESIIIKAGGNANVFYGLTLIENQHAFELLSDEFDLILAKHHYGKNYRQGFLTEVEGGWRLFCRDA